MSAFLIKYIIAVFTLWVISSNHDELYYPKIYHFFITSLIIAVTGILMSRIPLVTQTIWMNTTYYVFVAALAIFLISFFLPNSYVTLHGAFFTASIVGLLELIIYLVVRRHRKLTNGE
ncbi:hypothetical protein [Dendrosporobacter sp. 1207_IL3150]|uniref:hypothetical protein n=1 Tax=Dendrosporobacter sp. 1207_IL3150 TaxID=3084054 RepID=UPI002FD94208